MSYKGPPDPPIVATLRMLFQGINGANIGKSVDDDGIEDFILRAAWLSGASGATAASSGPVTLVLGYPADMATRYFSRFELRSRSFTIRRGSIPLPWSRPCE